MDPITEPDLSLWAKPTGLPTPYVALDRARLEANLDRVGTIARDAAVALRPHVKTHKCLEIARMQIDRGASGLTASKPQEAIVFMKAGFRSVTVAYPVVSSESARSLLDQAKSGCELRFVVDSVAGVEAIAAALESGETVSTYVEVDVGLGRCGILPGSKVVQDLVRAAARVPGLTIRGLLSHAGHAYGAKGPDEIASIADDELRQLKVVARQFVGAGVPACELSVGSTPTVLASNSFEGISEIRPGNYVFCDLTACRLGVAELNDVALGVVTTIVSTNDRYCIVDAGSKALSSDTGPHGSGNGGYGLCFSLQSAPSAWTAGKVLTRLSEEHGFVEHGGEPLPIGTRALVFPNHSCPVVNLTDELVVLRAGSKPQFWEVAARGKVT